MCPMKYLTCLLIACTFWGCTAQPATPIASDEYDDDIAVAVQRAEGLYRQIIASGHDISSGPCISNKLIRDWVADIAHNPRDPAIDDLPENQCEAFLNGTAHHFVELDIDGKLIRAL